MLIFFWNQPSSQPPVTPTDLFPSVIKAVELVTPSLILVQTATGQLTDSTILYSSSADTYNSGVYGGAMEPEVAIVDLSSFEFLTPTISFIDKSTGVFEDSTVTYSSASNTYNDGTYGGTSYPQPLLPNLRSIDAITPELYSFNK